MCFLQMHFTCKPAVIKNEGQPDGAAAPHSLRHSWCSALIWGEFGLCCRHCPVHTSQHPWGPLPAPCIAVPHRASPYCAVHCRIVLCIAILCRAIRPEGPSWPSCPCHRGAPCCAQVPVHQCGVEGALGLDPSAQLSALVNTPNSPA